MEFLLNNSIFFKSVGFISYIVQAICFYSIAKKVGLKEELFLAFIPILQFILFFHIIDKSALNILWFCIPILNILLLVYWYVEFFSRFNISLGIVLLSILIPGGLLILFLYVAFSDNVHYVGTTSYK